LTHLTINRKFAPYIADSRLKLEDCIPDTELKARIDAWVAEGQSEQAARVMEVDQL